MDGAKLEEPDRPPDNSRGWQAYILACGCGHRGGEEPCRRLGRHWHWLSVAGLANALEHYREFTCYMLGLTAEYSLREQMMLEDHALVPKYLPCIYVYGQMTMTLTTSRTHVPILNVELG